MAEIKNYWKEREKREGSQIDYQSKIRRYKLKNALKLVVVLLLLGSAIAVLAHKYQNYAYTDYATIATISRETAADAMDIRFGDAILTYSKDGAHSTDLKGDVKWNQTYEMQDIKLEVCGNVVAIGNYNGRQIYIQDTEKQLGTIDTAMPIRNLSVSATGYVAAVLADTNVTWINTYNAAGEMQYHGQTSMNNSGYPIALSLSPNGELMAVSYLYVDAGVLKTDIAFYNLGPVGDNYSDYLVSGYTCQDVIIPEIQFMTNDTAFALGDSRLALYSGAQIPVEAGVYLFSEEVQSVFYNEQYVGLVFYSGDADNKYRLEVFNKKAEKTGTYYFDMDYTEIILQEKEFIIYNESQCLIRTYSGAEKYSGDFSKTVNLMIPTQTAYRYILVTQDTIDTIQLK